MFSEELLESSFWSLAAPITAFVSPTVGFADFIFFRLVVFLKKGCVGLLICSPVGKIRDKL